MREFDLLKPFEEAGREPCAIIAGAASNAADPPVRLHSAGGHDARRPKLENGDVKIKEAS